MIAHFPIPHPPVRTYWLRQGTSPSSYAQGNQSVLLLSKLGIAAAHETFATATLPLAAAWTDLFANMLAHAGSLRWRENGPGVGRDARIAYSSLLGRYMAREHLTGSEGVRVLVPLDEAKRVLKGKGYAIRKHPSGPGLEADWIGLDDYGLIIAEAKGSFDKRVKKWHGPDFIPDVLSTAIAQAQRTAVFRGSTSVPLPAKRFGIASRWANEVNQRDPTLLAWRQGGGMLNNADYRDLARLLHRADLEAVLKGLGHPCG